MTQTKLDPMVIDYCTDNNLPLPKDAETANAAWEVMDAEDGTIQAADMVRLFPGRPEMHTATTFRALLRSL